MNIAYRTTAPVRRDFSEGPSPLSTMGIFAVALLLMILLRRYSPARRGWAVAMAAAGAAPSAKRSAPGFVDLLDRNQSTAVFLVGTAHDPGPRMIDAFAAQQASRYRQVLLLAVGALDAEDPFYEGDAGRQTDLLRKYTRRAVEPYLDAARKRGYAADCRVSVAVDPGKEIGPLADAVVRLYSRVMFFVGESDGGGPGPVPGTADGIRRYLERRGIPVTVVPVPTCGRS